MSKIKIFKSGSNQTDTLESNINQFLIENEVDLVDVKTMVNDGEIICILIYK